MGSFRSPASRTEDQGVLAESDRPEDIAPEHWLQEGETITYWIKLPYRAAVRLANEGMRPVLDGQRVTDLRVQLGSLQTIKLEEGIVGWTLRDERNRVVPWDRKRAPELLEGIPNAVRERLTAVIEPNATGDTDPESEVDAGKD